MDKKEILKLWKTFLFFYIKYELSTIKELIVATYGVLKLKAEHSMDEIQDELAKVLTRFVTRGILDAEIAYEKFSELTDYVYQDEKPTDEHPDLNLIKEFLMNVPKDNLPKA